MYTSTGIVSASGDNQKKGWFFLECDAQLGDYYNWLYDHSGSKKHRWNKGINGVHITFIAGEKDERIIGRNEMKHFMGKELEFSYDNKVWTNTRGFWMPVVCHELDIIRYSLGLVPRFLYHVTLGNVKYLENQ